MAPWIVSLGTASPLSFVSIRSTSCKSPVICPRDCRFQSNCVSCRLREPRPAHDLHALYPPAPAHALRHSARCKFRHKEATFQHLSSLVPVIITNVSILWELDVIKLKKNWKDFFFILNDHACLPSTIDRQKSSSVSKLQLRGSSWDAYLTSYWNTSLWSLFNYVSETL